MRPGVRRTCAPVAAFDAAPSLARVYLYRSCRWGALSLRAAAALLARFSPSARRSLPPSARRIAERANALPLGVCAPKVARAPPRFLSPPPATLCPRFPSHCARSATLRAHATLSLSVWARYARPRRASRRVCYFPTVECRGCCRSKTAAGGGSADAYLFTCLRMSPGVRDDRARA